MTAKEHLAKAIESLLYSWGGDTPPEAFWVLSDIIKFVNNEYQQSFEDLDAEEMTEENEAKVETLLTFLKS